MGTFDKVKKIVVDQLGVNEADVQIDSTFIDDLGADSYWNMAGIGGFYSPERPLCGEHLKKADRSFGHPFF